MPQDYYLSRRSRSLLSTTAVQIQEHLLAQDHVLRELPDKLKLKGGATGA